MKGYDILDQIDIGVWDRYDMSISKRNSALIINIGYHTQFIRKNSINHIETSKTTTTIYGDTWYFTVWNNALISQSGIRSD